MDYDLMRRRLIEARENIGYNRKEFAEKVNIPYRTITNYENGAREAGSDYLTRVATICGVTTDWLLGVSDIKKSPSVAEAAPGDRISEIFDKLNDMLVSEGLIKDGEDLTDRQAEVLLSICRIIGATFQN